MTHPILPQQHRLLGSQQPLHPQPSQPSRSWVEDYQPDNEIWAWTPKQRWRHGFVVRPAPEFSGVIVTHNAPSQTLVRSPAAIVPAIAKQPITGDVMSP